jgi:hypothetical protein
MNQSVCILEDSINKWNQFQAKGLVLLNFYN